MDRGDPSLLRAQTPMNDAPARPGSAPPVPGESGLQHTYLFPGKLIACAQPRLVTTVLGSCVSVCLCDPVAGIGGLNHFLLPARVGSNPEPLRFGNEATETLIQTLLELGASRRCLQAKLFGGMCRSPGPGMGAIGQKNVAVAEAILQAHRIPVIGQDVLGPVGRKLWYLTSTGEAWITRLGNQG